MSSRPAPHRELCQNCETPLSGPYCHRCGQKDFDFHHSFGHVVHEALETWFHIDGSFLRGFHELLFRPGLMTRDFNAGRRARHVPPFRFYLVISLLFFLVFRPSSVTGSVDLDEAFAVTEEQAAHLDAEERAQLEELPEVVERAMARHLSDPNHLVQTFYDALPKMLLVCLPLFALITRLFFRAAPWSYLQHLILSLHLHTFVYLWSLVVSGWTGLAGLVAAPLAEWLSLAALLYGIFYYFAALRRALGISIGAAVGKGLLIAWLYGLVLLFAFLTTIAITIYWL